nr:hypothetical protein [Tanacetum cinerariifolium]
MTHLVTGLTLDSARSCMMQVTSFAQGKVSSIPTIHSWGGNISPNSFLPYILLLVVFVVAVVIVVVAIILVVVVVVVSSIIKLSFVITVFGTVAWENTDSVHSNQRMSPTAPSVPLKLKGSFAMLAACASRAVTTLSATSFLIAACVMAGIAVVNVSYENSLRSQICKVGQKDQQRSVIGNGLISEVARSPKEERSLENQIVVITLEMEVQQ